MSTIKQLAILDPEVWVSGSARVVQAQHQPICSLEPPVIKCFSLRYRSVYYWSNDLTRPYVFLIGRNNLKYPLVKTCGELTYQKFLRDHTIGVFDDFDVEIINPTD